jgi:hypothetical protein
MPTLAQAAFSGVSVLTNEDAAVVEDQRRAALPPRARRRALDCRLDGRTVSTGTGAWRTTFSATLPMST